MAKRWQGKRRQWQMGDELEQVDDLAFAAQFAVPPVLAQVDDVKEDTTLQNDADEIDVDDEDSDESIDEADNQEDENKNGDEDSSDDDESDVDLAEAMTKMQDDDEDGPPSSATPKTEHELDPYRTPMEELEKHLEFNLTVEEQDRLRLGGSTTTSANISLAGIVRNCMVQDRTLIVESAPGTRPLDEGSFLVIRLTTDDLRLIPLGRIFEVFGPVSQPLYTIRLPPAPTEPKPKKKQGAETTKAPAMKPKQEATTEVPMQEIPIESVIASDTATKTDESNPSKESLGESKRVEEKQSEPKEAPTTNEDSPNTPLTEEQIKEDTPAGSKQAGMETVDVSNEILGRDSTPVVVSDPWAADGEYTKIIKSNDQMSVYFVVDEAKLIDTGAVMRKSGKGCDASNLYDEEVLNANEMYYSDDEEERDAKNRRKKGKKGGAAQRNTPQQSQGFNQPPPQGFHQPPPQGFQQPPSQGFHQPPSQGFHQPPPQGFHQPPPQEFYPPQVQGFHQPPPRGFHQPQGIPPPPPPPPPPPRNYQPHPNQPPPYHPYGVPTVPPPVAYASGAPPPPPPNPAYPPAYDYS